MKILIVDDEAPARDRLQHMISLIDNMQVCGQAAHGLEAVTMAQTTQHRVNGHPHARHGRSGGSPTFK